MLFHKKYNKQIQVYTIQQHLELEIGKTCEACSLVLWKGTCTRPKVLSPSLRRVNSSYKFTYT